MTTKSTETLVRELLDREAIRDLPLRYCHYVWRKDVEGIASLFTEDGSIVFEEGSSLPSAQGQDNLIKAYKQGLTDLTPLPFIHNHVIELKGPIRLQELVMWKYVQPVRVQVGLALATMTMSTPRWERSGSSARGRRRCTTLFR